MARLRAVDAYDLSLYIGANSNSKMLSQVNPQQQSKAAVGYKPILDMILGRAAKNELRWCKTMFPTPSAAQDAEMGNLDYEDFIFEAGFLNDADPQNKWLSLGKKQENLKSFLETKHELRFQNRQGTDLRVNISGMKWVNCCGNFNFPDGEVFTGPNLMADDGGVNGVVRFAMPTIYCNVEVHDIELQFHQGAVVEARASKNEAFLKEMIAQDEGAKFVGEIAIGTNYHIKQCTKNILFDEKIGGTFHLALGKGYPETGNTNLSALHWDMIFDLSQGGSIYVEGELIQENGRFLRDDWPS
jgi:aminopeptidase